MRDISIDDAEPLNDVEERAMYDMICEMHRALMQIPTIPAGPTKQHKSKKSKARIIEFASSA